jgi:hypothetical protein
MSFSDVPSIVIEYKNERPLEVIELASSLAAFAQQFERSVTKAGGPSHSQLYVREVRSGSSIFELIETIGAVHTLMKSGEYLAPFLSHWQETLLAVLTLSPKAKDLDRQDVKAARSFVQPLAHDAAGKIGIVHQSAATINNQFYLTSDDARQILNNGAHLLSALPHEQPFTNEPMVLFQVRDGPATGAGDRGFIDKFSPNSKKLTFSSDEVKDAILASEGKPFELVFFVSGVAKTAGGVVAAYHINRLDGTAPREVE